MERIKTLMHVHTDYSYDSDISLDTLAQFAESHGFGCVAVTDHDTIDGARRLRGLTDVKVIVGEEVTTRDGHLIGLFLRERVRSGMSALDTAKAVRDQGGLVLLPHPFVRAVGCGLGDVAWRIADLVDAVEVHNAQNLNGAADRRASRLADQVGLVKFVGADSHASYSIAPCYQLMADFNGPSDFLNSLQAAELRPGRHPLRYFAGAACRVARYVMGLPPPAGFGACADRSREAAAGEPALSPAGRAVHA